MFGSVTNTMVSPSLVGRAKGEFSVEKKTLKRYGAGLTAAPGDQARGWPKLESVGNVVGIGICVPQLNDYKEL